MDDQFYMDEYLSERIRTVRSMVELSKDAWEALGATQQRALFDSTCTLLLTALETIDAIPRFLKEPKSKTEAAK